MDVRFDVPLQPIEFFGLGFGAGDDQVGVLAETRDGQIRFDAAALVQPLRVDDSAGRNRHVIGGDSIDYALGIAAFQPKLGERRLIEKTDTGAHGVVLPGAGFEPILTAIAVVVAGFATGWGVPIGAFPAERLAEARAA